MARQHKTSEGAWGKRPAAIVTGGARRVGRAICLALAEAGYDIVTTYRSRPAEAAETVRMCMAKGVSARAQRLDMGDARAVEKQGRAWSKEMARVDALVHNASVYEATPMGKITAEACREHFEVNAMGPVLLTQALAGALGKARGCVVMMCDMHALGAGGRSRRRYAAYAMSKAALAEMVGTLARELGPKVRVNGIAPGVVAWPDKVDQAEVRKYEARIPLGRPGKPEDAAAAAVFLVRDGQYVNGEIVRVDGGRFFG